MNYYSIPYNDVLRQIMSVRLQSLAGHHGDDHHLLPLKEGLSLKQVKGAMTIRTYSMWGVPPAGARWSLSRLLGMRASSLIPLKPSWLGFWVFAPRGT